MDEKYKLPESRDVLLDPATGEVEDIKPVVLTPWDKIKKSAEMYNIGIKEPNKNCKKCYGRGYTAIQVETGIPIACKCIFIVKTKEESVNEDDSANVVLDRKQRRKLDRVCKRLKNEKV